LGADDYIAQNDEAAMTAGVKTLDLIIDTIPANHDINPPLNLAKKKGTYVVVGVATEPFQVCTFLKNLIPK
jgi:D-arabinose 1-dehydrogenase-like Zn-dependent alcohol dehydrogenase